MRKHVKHPAIVFDVPITIMSANKLLRYKWYTYQNYKTRMMKSLSWLIPARPDKQTKKVSVSIIGKRKRLMDHDNFVMGCKPIFDFLKNRGYLVDDSDVWLSRQYHQEKAKNDSVSIIIEEI